MVRDFKKNPITTEELMQGYWYAVVDDTIGGFAISNVDEPVSQINPYEGKFELANFMDKGTAEHIAYLHNAWWEYTVWSSYANNILVALENDVADLTEDDWFDYDDEYEAT